LWRWKHEADITDDPRASERKSDPDGEPQARCGSGPPGATEEGRVNLILITLMVVAVVLWYDHCENRS
jgi:hypothetical protein